MLANICAYLHNWFITPNGVHKDTFNIDGGSIALPFLKNGQYFRVVGSVFNDGIYQYPTIDLTDEEFMGEVWALAIPPKLTELATKIVAWENSSTKSAYQSESFGGYSYSKGDRDLPTSGTWKEAFKGELAQWRKI